MINTNKLRQAIKVGDIKQLTEMLREDPKGKLRLRGGFSPLHVAAKAGNKDVVEAVLDAGSDINATTEMHQTPLDLAQRYGTGPSLNFCGRGERTRLPNCLFTPPSPPAISKPYGGTSALAQTSTPSLTANCRSAWHCGENNRAGDCGAGGASAAANSGAGSRNCWLVCSGLMSRDKQLQMVTLEGVVEKRRLGQALVASVHRATSMNASGKIVHDDVHSSAT